MVQRYDRLTSSIEMFIHWYLNGDGGEQRLNEIQDHQVLQYRVTLVNKYLAKEQ